MNPGVLLEGMQLNSKHNNKHDSNNNNDDNDNVLHAVLPSDMNTPIRMFTSGFCLKGCSSSLLLSFVVLCVQYVLNYLCVSFIIVSCMFSTPRGSA